MKKVFLLIAVIILISQNQSVFAKSNDGLDKLIAYYFHGSYRCPTCRKLEQYSKEAIEDNFKDALSQGKIEFKVINVEDRGNEHFVDDYQLYTKALVISLNKDGKEIKYKNLEKIWDYVGNKDKFFEYINEEINNFLKE